MPRRASLNALIVGGIHLATAASHGVGLIGCTFQAVAAAVWRTARWQGNGIAE
jgi:hypothetical protein